MAAKDNRVAGTFIVNRLTGKDWLKRPKRMKRDVKSMVLSALAGDYVVYLWLLERCAVISQRLDRCILGHTQLSTTLSPRR